MVSQPGPVNSILLTLAGEHCRRTNSLVDLLESKTDPKETTLLTHVGGAWEAASPMTSGLT